MKWISFFELADLTCAGIKAEMVTCFLFFTFFCTPSRSLAFISAGFVIFAPSLLTSIAFSNFCQFHSSFQPVRGFQKVIYFWVGKCFQAVIYFFVVKYF